MDCIYVVSCVVHIVKGSVGLWTMDASLQPGHYGHDSAIVYPTKRILHLVTHMLPCIREVFDARKYGSEIVGEQNKKKELK